MSDVSPARPSGHRPRMLAGALAAALAVSVLGGCGSDEGSPKSGGSSSSSSSSATASAYLPVPGDAELTAPGTKLHLGDDAVVGWRPNQNVTAALDVTVDRIERTTFDKSFQGWQVDDKTAATTPYFARVTVRNTTDEDLGSLSVPLWGQDDAGVLIQAQAFTDRVFEPCHPSAVPATFAPGAKAQLCFVFLVTPGRSLHGVAFQPQTETSDGVQALPPITWTGKISKKVQPPKPPKKSKKNSKKSEKSDKKGAQGKKSGRG